MSTPENESPAVIIPPDKSKVEISRNAKGDPQWRIVAVDGATDNIDVLRQIAVQQYLALERDLLGLTR
jgi:hypothetical protein